MASPSGSKFPLMGRFHRAASCNEILPRLYLGDICIATDKNEISRLGITDMITVEIKPLQASDLASCVKRYLYINVMDHSKQDILSHFETSNEFIETALKNPTNKVYVHCVAGISRSATLVIAYVMKTKRITYTEAYDLVQSKRRVVDPNEGFVRQLVLYHKMNYIIDIGNTDYRRTVLDALVFEFRLISLSYYQVTSSTTKLTPGSSSTSSNTIDIFQMPTQGHKNLPNRNNVGLLFDQYYNKLHLQQVSKYPQVYNPNSAYKCNKCRSIVFYAISMIENKLNQSDSQQQQTLPMRSYEGSRTHSSFASISSSSAQSKRDPRLECPFIFIEPQPWMSRNVLERDGNLECYKCKRKLGKFDWTSGESCSCALHNSNINFNLFKIMRKKVDAGHI